MRGRHVFEVEEGRSLKGSVDIRSVANKSLTSFLQKQNEVPSRIHSLGIKRMLTAEDTTDFNIIG